MKLLLPALLLSFITITVFGQQSDFIVIKKHNNRTLKTYYPGSFMTAETYSGFRVNGFITAIRNDSIVLRQHETKLISTDFGQKLDTVVYVIKFHYQDLKRFEMHARDIAGRKKGFLTVTGPKLLMIGGVGFIALELINTAYRGEKLGDGKKLTSIAIAAGVAVTGYVWNQIANSRDKVGGRYKVVYIKAVDGNISK
jgi:hypothetical protein